MNIKIVTSQREKDDALLVRRTVFVEEQQVPLELEIDGHENEAIHFVGYNDENKPIAASRVRLLDHSGKLERICVLKEYRGQSYGKQIIRFMEAIIQDNKYTKALLHSQTHAQKFYEELGYKVISDVFMDAGIPHIKMKKSLQ